MARILIIDDDPGFRRMIDLTLTRAHHVVITAKDGFEGVDLFKAERPDMVISDMVMPRKEGAETIIEIRAMTRTMPIIAMSGGGADAGPRHLDEAQKLGANEIISKPFRPADLIALVNRFLPSET